jgi:hypothetical protein
MFDERPLLLLWLIGGGAGLVFGLSYWFAWGCRNCASQNSALGIVGFCVVVGGLMARWWGIDHLRRPS